MFVASLSFGFKEVFVGYTDKQSHKCKHYKTYCYKAKNLVPPMSFFFGWICGNQIEENDVFQVFHLLRSENESGTWLCQHCQVSKNPGVLSTLLLVSQLLKQISTDQIISSFSAPNKERKWLSIRLINQPSTYCSSNTKKPEANPSFSKCTLVMQINQTTKGHI